MMFSQKPRSVGFTLLELCLAIGVVAVLTVLAYAGYQRLSQSSGKISCVNNLRQIGAAILHYSGDHQGLLPGPIVGAQRVYVSRHTLTPGNGSSLADYVASYFGITDVPVNQTVPVREFICEAGRRGVKTRGVAVENGLYYIHLLTYVNPSTIIYPFGATDGTVTSKEPERLLAVREIKELSKMIALVDEDHALMNMPPRNLTAPRSPLEPAHGNARNVLYLDGHVSSVPVTNFSWRGMMLEIQ